MTTPVRQFRRVARWPVVITTGTGRGHPEPRRRHRRSSKLGYLNIRALLSELARWKREAMQYGITLSDLVRAKLNDAPVRVVHVADPAFLEELKRQGNNLNQLIHAIHGNLPVAPARVVAVLAELQRLYRHEIERG